MEHYFKGKTVLVTGAGWGIGAATALLYAAYGAKVIVSDIDVSNAAACEELIKRTIRTYGSIDIACNNSAVLSESADDQMGLDLAGLHNCMHYEIEAMQRQGGGIIVNTSSIMGAIGLAPSNQYIEAKYGRTMLLQDIPGAYPAIHIHTIAPAFIDTALQEVAGLVLWLTADKSRIFSKPGWRPMRGWRN
jgi:NAD(P)-dependent dehydrogenase (short-subunit alcohol dehydrogenase family)